MILSILSYKAWMIEPLYASRMVPILLRELNNGTLNQFFEQSKLKQKETISAMYAGLETEFAGSRDEPSWHVATAKNGRKVAIIPMMGAITKNGDGCSYGMRDYQNVMARIAKNDSITAVVFHFNNAPGGTNDGTPEISHFIKNFSKPTLAFADGMVASAHYWMASQTNHIMANRLTETELGSIGSLIPWQNIQNMIDAGTEPSMEIIRAPQSTNKARFNILEPLTDELRQELLDGLEDSVKGFISDVKKGRGAALKNDKEMFTGKMYSTDEAIANGLADSKGTLTDAINKAAQLAAQIKPSTSSSSRAQVNTMSYKSKLLSAIFGKSEKAAEEQPPTAEEHQALMDTADAKAVEMEAENQKLQDEKASQDAKVAELEKSVSDQAGQITTLTSEKTALAEEKTKLEAKVADLQKNSGTTIIPNAEKDANPAADSGAAEKKTHRTSADDESDKYVNAMYPNDKK